MKITRRGFLAGVVAATAAAAPRAAGDELTPGQYPLGLDRVRDGVLYVPKHYRPGVPTPLVLLCHGAGGSGLGTQYANAMADDDTLLLLAPDSRDERTWDLVLGEYGPDADFIAAAMRQTFGRCTVDRSRLTVAGHSDGASYALSFGISAGDVFGHVMAFSPGVLTPVAATGHPRVFISHGTSDPVMPIDDTSRKFVPRLRALGYDVTYQEYDGGHGVPDTIVRSGFAWLQRT
jgi:predicted esterase